MMTFRRPKLRLPHSDIHCKMRTSLARPISKIPGRPIGKSSSGNIQRMVGPPPGPRVQIEGKPWGVIYKGKLQYKTKQQRHKSLFESCLAPPKSPARAAPVAITHSNLNQCKSKTASPSSTPSGDATTSSKPASESHQTVETQPSSANQAEPSGPPHGSIAAATRG